MYNLKSKTYCKHYILLINSSQLIIHRYKEIYIVTKSFPKDELFGLTSQIRRAVVSIPSNIAEGSGRNTDKNTKRFVDIAQGSSFEVETQFILAFDLGIFQKKNLIHFGKIQTKFNE